VKKNYQAASQYCRSLANGFEKYAKPGTEGNDRKVICVDFSSDTHSKSPFCLRYQIEHTFSPDSSVSKQNAYSQV
jgi:hypothetical protein